MQRVIAIDFDGTICENEYPAIGEPKWGVIRAALREKRAGAALVLWTTRTGEQLEAALMACKRWGLPLDGVNENLEEWRAYYGNDPRKIGATEYWDDKAVPIAHVIEQQERYELQQRLRREADELRRVADNEADPIKRWVLSRKARRAYEKSLDAWVQWKEGGLR